MGLILGLRPSDVALRHVTCGRRLWMTLRLRCFVIMEYWNQMAAASVRRLSSIAGCSLITPKPRLQPPLFLRAPAYTHTFSDLRKWRRWARSLTARSSIGASDHALNATLLRREINWLLEDVFEDKSYVPLIDDDDGRWDDDRPVKIRVCVDELYRLWKQRIEERRPFQYLVGCEHWRDLVLCVQDGVLIPRPETEIIVDLVRSVVEERKDLRDGIWADLGTGSGALAIGIARVIGSCGRVVATDLSPVAAAVAQYNVQRYSLQDKIEIREGSWFEPLKDVRHKLAGLVSNPPYIPSEHIAGLQPEVGRHEPIMALDGGSDGMDYLLHLCNEAVSMLKPGGYFAFETNGEKHCQFIDDYLKNNLKGCFSEVNIVSDFANIPRFVTGFRSS